MKPAGLFPMVYKVGCYVLTLKSLCPKLSFEFPVQTTHMTLARGLEGLEGTNYNISLTYAHAGGSSIYLWVLQRGC